MHHKRRRPKSSRAGCLMCKPWKHQRAAKEPRTNPGHRRPVVRERMAIAEGLADRLNLTSNG